jgi:ABC-type polysaccharide/polyol phosphate export permease
MSDSGSKLERSAKRSLARKAVGAGLTGLTVAALAMFADWLGWVIVAGILAAVALALVVSGVGIGFASMGTKYRSIAQTIKRGDQ